MIQCWVPLSKTCGVGFYGVRMFAPKKGNPSKLQVDRLMSDYSKKLLGLKTSTV